MPPTCTPMLRARAEQSDGSSMSDEAIIAIISLLLMLIIPCVGYAFRHWVKQKWRRFMSWLRQPKRPTYNEPLFITNILRDPLGDRLDLDTLYAVDSPFVDSIIATLNWRESRAL